MKTALDQLAVQLKQNHGIDLTLYNEFNEAKEMEKEQMIEAHFNGCETGEMFNNENRAFITDSEQYYNEIFKQE